MNGKVSIPRLHVPMLCPTDVIAHLGQGRSHWKVGRSAHALAHVWFRANGLPARVADVLQAQPHLAEAKLIEGFFERETDLGDGAKPSQTDLLALIELDDRLAVLAVEGKVDDAFGDQTVGAWLDGKAGSDPKGRVTRLGILCDWLGLDPEAARTRALRYQLLHRTVSALIEARRWRCAEAIMLVHSFGPIYPKGDRFDDFVQFCAAMGALDVRRHAVAAPLNRQGIKLWLGWVCDEAPWDD